jgi:oligopeptide transport system permease protein
MRDFTIRLLSNRTAVIGLIVFVLLLLLATIGPYVYTTDPDTIGSDYNINGFPSSSHPLGTDSNGRDTLARLMAGLRVSLLVAGFVEVLNILLGATLGLLAGYYGGWIDWIVTRLADMLFAFPGLLLAILVAAVFGSAVEAQFGGMGRLILVTSSLSLISWPLMARYVRSQTLALRESDFVLAAHATGASDGWIIAKHILPSLIGLIIVSSTLDIANVVINESVLSLLGLGVQAPSSSIGIMIVQATPFLETNWTQVFFPSVTLSAIVLAVSFIGDGLRDALDPREVRR